MSGRRPIGYRTLAGTAATDGKPEAGISHDPIKT